MSTSELMEAMAAAGAPFEAILIAVKALEDKDALIRAGEAEGQKRRAKDAERKRAARAAMSKDCPRTIRGRGADGSPNDIYLTPSTTPLDGSNEPSPPSLKPEHVVEVWNEQAEGWGLRPIRKLTPQRRRKLLTRIRENTIDEFTEAISAIGRSPFLRGENARGWRADFDWMLEPKNFTKLQEGTYER